MRDRDTRRRVNETGRALEAAEIELARASITHTYNGPSITGTTYRPTTPTPAQIERAMRLVKS